MIKTPVFSTGEGVETFVKNTKETCRMEHILLILMVTMNGYYMINDLIYIYIYILVGGFKNYDTSLTKLYLEENHHHQI